MEPRSNEAPNGILQYHVFLLLGSDAAGHRVGLDRQRITRMSNTKQGPKNSQNPQESSPHTVERASALVDSAASKMGQIFVDRAWRSPKTIRTHRYSFDFLLSCSPHRSERQKLRVFGRPFVLS
jgi:hypothetical protein